MSKFDTRAFRDALGCFATGITVVTAQDEDGNKVGVTANSFNSVSLDPPLILWSVDKKVNAKDVFLNASHFAINVLAADQVHVSNIFARPAENRFANVEYRIGAGGCILIEECTTHFECELYQTVDAGDHIIIIGKVVDFSTFDKSPLLYHRGVYSAVFPHSSLDLRADLDAKDSEQKSVCSAHMSSSVGYLMRRAMGVYQQEYFPKQSLVGLSRSEIQVVMLLNCDTGFTINTLLQEVGVPFDDLRYTVESLEAKGLAEKNGNTIMITEAGRQKANQLFDIAKNHQDYVFSEFTESELTLFKKILKHIIKRETVLS